MSGIMVPARTPVGELEVEAFTIPTDAPEADGTLRWEATTIVVVHASAGGVTGLGLQLRRSGHCDADPLQARPDRGRL